MKSNANPSNIKKQRRVTADLSFVGYHFNIRVLSSGSNTTKQ